MTQREKDISLMIGGRIKSKDPSAKVVLFGSHATGKATKDSDWDILILITQPKLSRDIEKLYRDELFELELEIGEPISSFIFNQKDWDTKYAITPLYKSIQNEGINLA